MLDYIFKLGQEYKTGLSLYYPLIYSIVVGLETKCAFEFGAGWSTRVVLDALAQTKGYLYSISTDSKEDVVEKIGLDRIPEDWYHAQGKSEVCLKHLRDRHVKEPFDFVLHDGSHTEEVVFKDLSLIIQKMKYNAVLLVHDVLHSQCGPGMRNAVSEALKDYEYEIVTLPYGFGLSIITLKDNKLINGVVQINRNKPTSKHHTEIN